MDSVYESKGEIVEIPEVLQKIKTQHWKNKIDEIRFHMNNGDSEQAGDIKRGLPVFTVSATFKGGRTKKHFDSYTLHLNHILKQAQKINPIYFFCYKCFFFDYSSWENYTYQQLVYISFY